VPDEQPSVQEIVERAGAELVQLRAAMRELAALFPGSDPEQPASVVFHARETLRETERVHARNTVLEERAKQATEILGGRLLR
jgi:hypothetical protein